MISQANISSSTPMGANLVPGGGATFRAWGPLANAVYINGTLGGVAATGQTDALLMAKDANGYWTGFVATAKEGDPYHFWVVGPRSSGYKRDPYARELARDVAFPACSCLVRSATAYPWHDSAFVTPDFTNMIVYQLHIGTYAPATVGAPGNFLDIIGKIPYLAALGANVIQPLPTVEAETDPSLGYDGSDYFSPDFPYVVTDPAALGKYLITINGLLTAKGFAPLAPSDIAPDLRSSKYSSISVICTAWLSSLMSSITTLVASPFTTSQTMNVSTTWIAPSMEVTTTTAFTSPTRTAAPAAFRSRSGTTTSANS